MNSNIFFPNMQRTIVGFGDESIDTKHVTYVVLFLPKESVKKAEETYYSIRSQYGVISKAPFHSSDYFSPKGRSRTPFSCILGRNVYDLPIDILKELTKLGATARGFSFVKGKTNLEDPEVTAKELGMEIKPGTAGEFGERDLSVMAFKGLMFGFQHLNKIPVKNLEIHLDNDDTVKWFFGKRVKISDRFTYIFEGEIGKANIHRKNKPPLLEMADLIGYTYNHLQNPLDGYSKSMMQKILLSIPHSIERSGFDA